MKHGWNKHLFAHPVSIKTHNLLQMDKEYIQPLHNKLLDIVINTGDKQNKSSNVKADMTDWDMHVKYEDFETLGKIVKVLLVQDTLPKNKDEAIKTQHKYDMREMWGAVYRKGDHTKRHWHWPCTWSFGYYLKTSKNTPPILFNNAMRADLIGNIVYYPAVGDLVIFPSEIYHEVPVQEADEERVMIAGNLQAVSHE
tara:strand:- start:51 stop:641 length:591 start_codon:yes stop_codon:yes gene_type:complete